MKRRPARIVGHENADNRRPRRQPGCMTSFVTPTAERCDLRVPATLLLPGAGTITLEQYRRSEAAS